MFINKFTATYNVFTEEDLVITVVVGGHKTTTPT